MYRCTANTVNVYMYIIYTCTCKYACTNIQVLLIFNFSVVCFVYMYMHIKKCSIKCYTHVMSILKECVSKPLHMYMYMAYMCACTHTCSSVWMNNRAWHTCTNVVHHSWLALLTKPRGYVYTVHASTTYTWYYLWPMVCVWPYVQQHAVVSSQSLYACIYM